MVPGYHTAALAEHDLATAGSMLRRIGFQALGVRLSLARLDPLADQAIRTLQVSVLESGLRGMRLVLDADGATTLVAGAFRGYLDGVEIGAGGGSTINAHTAAIGIGAMRGDTRFHDGDASGNGANFDGLIVEFHLWDRALSRIELRELLAPGMPGPGFELTSVLDRDRAVVLSPGQTLWFNGSATGGGVWSQVAGAGSATFATL